jgi:protein-tyrosine phosphatase
VVQINGSGWTILREGVLSAREVSEKAACRILFVCTGNTCRSPMAAALCVKHLAKHLGCLPEELLHRGFFVHSAGLAAKMGDKAAAQAVAAVAQRGVDLTSHETQPLTEDLVGRSDHLIVMTRSQLFALAATFPGVGPAARLLSPTGEDVPDPIGGEPQVYRDCARDIEAHLEELIPELVSGER